MKHKFKLLFVLIIFLFPVVLKAGSIGIVIGNDVRIRSIPSTESSDTVITTVNSGYILSVNTLNKYTGTGCADGWYQITYNGSIAYVCSTLVQISTSSTGYNTSGWTARVDEFGVNAWQDVNKSVKLSSLLLGTNLTVLETLPTNSNCPDEWYRVNFHNNQTGYVCSTYVTKKEDITLVDETYNATLQSLGFPETYWPYLAHLHSLHPNWTFIPVDTDLDWDDVINGEAGKNYIQNTNNAYRISDEIAEPSNWYYANNGTIAYYMDPRNFLFEKFIFMFEKLDYNESDAAIYPNVLRELFGSSYLAADQYINYFVNAGNTYNVNPVHLGSRVVQEGGSNSSYSAVSGVSNLYYNGFLLNGYYNYYNIGAHKDDYTTSPVTRGLAYAAGRLGNTSYGVPWNTREKAIMGGADFISSGYISKGQYSMYFQKFNTSPTATASVYTHQYMTNVQAPASEAFNTYDSYSDINLINNSYTFAIPIYDEMPNYISLPSIGSTNNNLSNISINGNELVDFDSDVLSYTYFVTNDTSSIELTATAENSASTLNGLGNIQLTDNSTSISITVTSESGEEKTYYIEVIKVEDLTTISELLNEINVNVTGSNITGIKVNTKVSEIISSINTKSPSAIVTIKNSSGTILANTAKLFTGSSITIKSVTNEIKTFTISVTGDVSGDGAITILDLLKIQKHLVGSNKLSGVYLNAADTNKDSSVTILDLLRVQKHLVGEINL